MPSSALAKPTLVEVAAAEAGNLEEPVPDETIKVWIGFLKPAFFDHLEIVDECNVQYCFDSTEDGMLLPFGQGLGRCSSRAFCVLFQQMALCP